MVSEIERSAHDAASIERDTPAACPGDLGDQGVSVEPTKGAADLRAFLHGIVPAGPEMKAIRLLRVVLVLAIVGPVVGFVVPPAVQAKTTGVCNAYNGAAWGLCKAYCEAMKCKTEDPQASAQACDNISQKFTRVTGDLAPDCRSYVSRDPDECAAIRFTCPGGTSTFFDDTGCGCEVI